MTRFWNIFWIIDWCDVCWIGWNELIWVVVIWIDLNWVSIFVIPNYKIFVPNFFNSKTIFALSIFGNIVASMVFTFNFVCALPQQSPVDDIKRSTGGVDDAKTPCTVSLWDYGSDGSLWVHPSAVINIPPVSSASSLYYSSYWPVYVSQWNAHSRVGVFNTLYRGKRDTIIFPYLVYFDTLYPLPLPQIWGSFVLTPFLYSSSPSLSASSADAAVSLAMARSSPACSHHCTPNPSPRFLSTALHISIISHVAIYCVTVFCLRLMHVSVG